MARAADECVIDAGGLVGRHVGDGFVAFFLAASTGSESAASRACIQAARALRDATVAIAARSELAPDDLVMRFGLHWGSTPYVGQITTGGRTEVTALGDEVNEGHASRLAPPEGERSPQRLSLSALTPTMPRRSTSTPTASATPRWRTCPRRRRRRAATPRRSPSARSRPSRHGFTCARVWMRSPRRTTRRLPYLTIGGRLRQCLSRYRCAL